MCLFNDLVVLNIEGWQTVSIPFKNSSYFFGFDIFVEHNMTNLEAVCLGSPKVREHPIQRMCEKRLSRLAIGQYFVKHRWRYPLLYIELASPLVVQIH